MTDDELAAIKARAEAAFEGPWVVSGPGHEVWTGPSNHLLCEDAYTAENAAFIAHARTDVPVLVAEVERLRASIADCSGSCS